MATRSTPPEVVQVLVDGHRDFLRFLERRVGSRVLAEDLLQEAFVRGLDRGSAVTVEGAVPWFYQVLRNAIVDGARRQGAARRALGALARELEDEAEPAPDLRDAICRCVGRLADALKPDYAAAIRRVEVDGVPVKDFAAEAGITPNNAAVRVFRAREALKKQVAASCGTCAEHGCVDCTCASAKSS